MRQYEKKCGRCGGTGIYSERCGGCFNCGGNRAVPGSGIVTVTVYTAEEKATAKLASERYRNARQTVRETAKALREARRLDTHAEWFAVEAVRELQNREPERYAKMLASLEAGNVEATVIALAEYAATGYPEWYGDK